MYLHNILHYLYRRKSHKAKFLLFHFLCSELYNHSQFFLHCHCNSLRSNNQLANHSKKIAHIQLSHKENEITKEYLLNAEKYIKIILNCIKGYNFILQKICKMIYLSQKERNIWQI